MMYNYLLYKVANLHEKAEFAKFERERDELTVYS
jgi:hypothetical protein